MPRRETSAEALGLGDVLPNSDFADTYAAMVHGQALDATTAASRAFGRAPGWITALLALRNLVVWPLRLKTGPSSTASQAAVGFFPVLSRSAGRMVLGLDDRHLDFRLVIDVSELGGGLQEIRASTVVKTHNVLGTAYLAAVKPFHRKIVPAMLAQVAWAGVQDPPAAVTV